MPIMTRDCLYSRPGPCHAAKYNQTSPIEGSHGLAFASTPAQAGPGNLGFEVCAKSDFENGTVKEAAAESLVRVPCACMWQRGFSLARSTLLASPSCSVIHSFPASLVRLRYATTAAAVLCGSTVLFCRRVYPCTYSWSKMK